VTPIEWLITSRTDHPEQGEPSDSWETPLRGPVLACASRAVKSASTRGTPSPCQVLHGSTIRVLRRLCSQPEPSKGMLTHGETASIWVISLSSTLNHSLRWTVAAGVGGGVRDTRPGGCSWRSVAPDD
jgi:hypothetical protein